MPYYQGDFYGQGSYYQGDPGLFGFLGRAAKAAIGFIPGVGPIARSAIDVVSSAITKAPKAPIMQRVGRVAGAVVARHPVLTAAGAAGAVGALGRMTAPGHALGAHAATPMKGFHVSKKTGRVVRNRRMNVCNPRALRRSLRRAHGFARLAMKTIHLIHPKKKGRFGGFKKRRRARV